MNLGITDLQYYDDIGDFIRSKNGAETTYKPSQMVPALEAAWQGGGGGDTPFFTIIQDYKSSNEYDIITLGNFTYIRWVTAAADVGAPRGMVFDPNLHNCEIVFVDMSNTNTAKIQAGHCTKTATLPSIVGSASGRIDYTEKESGKTINQGSANVYYNYLAVYGASEGDQIVVIIKDLGR